MRYAPYFLMLLFAAALPVSIFSPRFLGVVPAISAVALLLDYGWHYRKWPQLDRKWVLALGGFLSVYACSAFWAIDGDVVIKRSLKIAIVLLPTCITLSMLKYITIEQAKRICGFLPFAFYAAGALFLLEVFADYPIYRFTRGLDAEEKVHAFVTNYTAVCLTVLIWPCLYFEGKQMAVEKRSGAILRIAALWTTLVVCLSLTTSQSAILALIIAIPAFIAVFFLPRLIAGASCVALAFGILGAPWIALSLFEIKPEIFLKWKMSNAAQRMEIWDFIADRIVQKPWLGYGGEATKMIKDFQSDKIFFPKTEVLHPHNAALQLWIELGFLGAVLGTVFVFMMLRHMIILPAYKYAFTAFAVCITIAMVGYGMWQSWWLGCMALCGFIFTAAQQAEKEGA